MPDRPNMVVILTDQQTADAMSCAGNPDVATPAMDALAASGVRFERAYCTQPLCAPARASMWTGRMPSELGVTVNGGGIPPEHAGNQLGRLFAAAGYDCGYIGKWHLPGDAEETSGYATRIGTLPDDDLAQASVEFITRPSRQDPFLLVTSFNEPHGICQWARSQRPPSGEVPEPPPQAWPALPRNYARGTYEAELPRLARERLPNVHPTAGWGEDAWRRYRHAYFRLCERVDANIGRLLDALDSSGRREDTLVVFTSDHGDGVGAHQWNQKWILYEESARVPLIIVPPGGSTPSSGRGDRALVSAGLDLVPTMCDYAGITAPADLRGYSLRPVLDGRVSGRGSDQVVVETTWDVPGMKQATGRMVRTERYKYVCYAWGRNREELFDLEHDPGELCNLATTSSWDAVLDEHRLRLDAYCAAVADPFGRFVPAARSGGDTGR